MCFLFNEVITDWQSCPYARDATASKNSNSLKAHWVESIGAKIRLKGDGKVGFSKTPQNLQKMDIIEKYLLGV